MDVEHDDTALQELETDSSATGGFGTEVVRGFRKVMQVIRAAPDERVFYAYKSLRFEKLKGDRAHQRSLRINKKWRLVIELRGDAPDKKVGVIAIEDYH